MKTILLLTARLIAGVVRYPVEGPLTVSDDEADRAIEDQAATLAYDLEEQELKDMTAPQLTDLAATEEIDLGGRKKKADIIAAIEKARAERAVSAE